MSEVAEKAAEATAEVVEETIDGVVDVMEVVRNNPVTLAIVGVAGLGVGAVGGYFYAARKLGKEFDARLAAEIEESKEFYASVNKVAPDGAVLSPMDVLESRHPEAAASLREYQGRVEEPVELDGAGPWDAELDERQIRKMEQAHIHRVSVDKEPGPHGGTIETVEEKVETRNVFVDPTFDLEEEMKHRTVTAPYIITHDEYFSADKDYEQVSLTYYEKDDTLANEKDEPIRDVDKTIGDDHLVRFGHGSKDRNIVYVRNDRLGIDYEVIKSTGSYLDEVLGMPDEPDSLKHSVQAARRREFRRGD